MVWFALGVAIWLIESTCLHPGYGDYSFPIRVCHHAVSTGIAGFGWQQPTARPPGKSRTCGCLLDSADCRHSCLLPSPQFDCFEDFGERHARPLVDRGDVREQLSAEDADGPSLARHEETSKKAQSGTRCWP